MDVVAFLESDSSRPNLMKLSWKLMTWSLMISMLLLTIRRWNMVWDREFLWFMFVEPTF